MAERDLALQLRELTPDLSGQLGTAELGSLTVDLSPADLEAAQLSTAADPKEDTGPGLGVSILNELVKSYGLRHESGQWSWSVDNVRKSFKEDPFWTTLDYLVLGVPVAKWGTALRAVTKGSGVAGRAYQAGEFAGKTASTRFGRAVGAVAGSERAKAAEVYLTTRAPRTRIGRFFSSPVAQDPEYMALAAKFGADPADIRGLHSALERGRRAEAGMVERLRDNFLRKAQKAGLNDEQAAATVKMLETGVEPSDPRVFEFLGKKGQELYEAQWWFRNSIHEQAYGLGLISQAAYETNLKRYAPRIYEEYLKARKAARPHGVVDTAQAREGIPRFMKRKLSPEKMEELIEEGDLTRIMDPRLTQSELAKAGMVIAKQRYLQNLGNSIIAKDAGQVVEYISKALNDPKILKAYGLDDDAIFSIKQLADNAISMDGGINEATAEAIARAAGWKKLDDLFAGQKIPGYVARLPEALKNKFIDPTVIEDVQGIAKVADDLHRSNFLEKLYHHSLGFFRASKTAYNPATHFRNYYGSLVFHHLAVGGVGSASRGFTPAKGIAAFNKAEKSEDFMDALRSGVVGSSFDNEIQDALRAAYQGARTRGGRATAVDFLGESKLARIIQSGAGKAERLYRAEDEVWKLDAFIRLKQKFMTRGLGKQEAVERATLEVNKYFPNFLQNSDFTNFVRKAVPFASFATESVRIWRNALVHKPHLAFFWNHVTDAAGKTLGAMAGFSAEEIEAAEQSLPYYQKDKKMMLWPFRVEGKPVFLDMSYLIPMASIVEAGDAEASFFQSMVIDPTANPAANLLVAGTTGRDPFSGRKVEPRFTERQLGIPIESPKARTAVGLVEHMANAMLPPALPPSYVGVNLLELARGQKSPVSGQELEEGVWRTLLTNLGGMRLHEADVNSQMLNIAHEERLQNEEISRWWDRWRYAKANDDIETMDRARSNILTLRRLRGDDPKAAEDYFEKGAKKREPGKFRSVSTRHLREALARAERIGHLSEDDLGMLAELRERLRERTRKGSGRRRRRR